MSLQHAAKHLEKHGRNGDTVLVHMSKGEVKSLNDIAMAGGGQLTINPHTGLPEAGFLKSLLPMIAGAGLMAVSGGAINPMTAGLLVGGGTAAATGDIKKGLMAGLGAYGGAGLGSALASSGTQAAALEPAASAASATPTPSVMAQAPVAATPTATPLANVGDPNITQMFSQSAPSNPISAQTLGYNPPTPTPSVIGSGYSDALANQQAAFETGTTGERLSTMGKGAQDLTKPGGLGRFYENLGNVEYTYGPKTTLAAAAAPTLAYAMEPGKPPPDTPADSDPGQQYTFEANATNPTPTPDPYGREQKYYNQRYVPRAADGGFVKGILDKIAEVGGGGQSGMPAGYSYDANTQQYTKMASGGISDAGYNLGGYSDGGRLLRGPGDGVSDSIPAVIGKKQPARLADGEFVVPARIVSELGNGSTEAGARKLYAMMDRIQKARGKTVGKGKVAKNSRSEKYLPA
jgi:hypothetical protein